MSLVAYNSDPHYESQNIVVLRVVVTISQNQEAVLELHDGEEPEDAAAQFVCRHGLDPDAALAPLTQHIVSSLQKLHVTRLSRNHHNNKNKKQNSHDNPHTPILCPRSRALSAEKLVGSDATVPVHERLLMWKELKQKEKQERRIQMERSRAPLRPMCANVAVVTDSATEAVKKDFGDRMYRDACAQQSRLEEQRQAKELELQQQQKDSLRPAPKITTLARRSYSRRAHDHGHGPHRDRRLKELADELQRKEREQCTFQPNLSKTTQHRRSASSSGRSVASYTLSISSCSSQNSPPLPPKMPEHPQVFADPYDSLCALDWTPQKIDREATATDFKTKHKQNLITTDRFTALYLDAERRGLADRARRCYSSASKRLAEAKNNH
eukprot:PhM_4_TR14226/c0_g1_i1/m.66634